jgi:hypothetical protein
MLIHDYFVYWKFPGLFCLAYRIISVLRDRYITTTKKKQQIIFTSTVVQLANYDHLQQLNVMLKLVPEDFKMFFFTVLKSCMNIGTND